MQPLHPTINQYRKVLHSTVQYGTVQYRGWGQDTPELYTTDIYIIITFLTFIIITTFLAFFAFY